MNLLSKHQDIVATLREAYIPFEEFARSESKIFEHLNRLFIEEQTLSIKQIAQLVYIAGKNLQWLRLDKTPNRPKYCFYEPGDMISTIYFDYPKALEILFNHTKLKRATYDIPDKMIPSVAQDLLTDDDS